MYIHVNFVTFEIWRQNDLILNLDVTPPFPSGFLIGTSLEHASCLDPL